MTSQFVEFESKIENAHFEGVFDISPEELQKKLSDVALIDVREHAEYVSELGHIPGAELIVLHTLPDHLSKLPKDKTIVFVCHAGGRSAKATAYAKMNGFEHVYNMHGGMMFWNHLQLPVER